MRCKVRYISGQGSARKIQREQVLTVQGPQLRLGRGADCDVPLKDLRVSSHHADIVLREVDVVIQAVGDSPLRIDGVPTDRGVLAPGTEVEIGPYRLIVVPSEPGVDLAFELELAETASSETLVRPLGIQGALPSKRAMSWALFLLMLAVGLALPVAAYLTKTPPSSPGRVQPGLAAPATLAVLDRLWNPGELSPSHKFLLNRCEACHEQAFVKVRSEACGSCHADTRHHFDTVKFEFAGSDPKRCTGCHQEHRGAAGIVPVQQSLCAGCHQDLSRHPGGTKLLDAADFGTAHPQLRPSVPVDPASGQVVRATLAAPGAPLPPDFPKEKEGLKFSHLVHLTRTCERPASGDAKAATPEERDKTDGCLVIEDAKKRLNKAELDCGDCHVADPSGVDMRLPIMQDNCAACHRLQFDPSAPDRTLPHGQPDDVIGVITDYYTARQASGKPVVEPVPLALQRRVGAPAPQPTATPVAPRDPQRTAPDVARQRLDTIFGTSLCGECHEVIRPEESAKKKWEVRPVLVPAVWMPKARFTHAAHKTSACSDCHAARTSRTSEDVLMPPIETCRKCHGGAQAVALVPSTCTDCHVYHREGMPAILPRPAQASAKDLTVHETAEAR